MENNSAEILYSPTQNFNDEDFKSDSEKEKNQENTKKSNSKSNLSKTKFKKNSKIMSKKKKKSDRKRSTSSHSSTKSSSRSRSRSSVSAPSPSSSSSQKSSSKSPSHSSRNKKYKRRVRSKSKEQHNSRHNRRRDDEPRRVTSKSRRSRSRENRYRNVDPYRYHSSLTHHHSRDRSRHNDDSINNQRNDRGDGRDRSRDDRSNWRKERSDLYNNNRHNNRNYDKYRNDRTEEMHRSRHNDEISLQNNLPSNELPNHAESTKNFNDRPENFLNSNNDNGGTLILPKQVIKSSDNMEFRSQPIMAVEPRPSFPMGFNDTKSIQPNVIYREVRPSQNFLGDLRPTIGSSIFRGVGPIIESPVFQDIRPSIERPTNFLQIRSGMQFNTNQPIIRPPNQQQFRIIGPPRQQGALVFRPVQIMEHGMEWRMDVPIISQPNQLQLSPNIAPNVMNTSLFKPPPLEFLQNQGNRILLPIPPPPLYSSIQSSLQQPPIQLNTSGDKQISKLTEHKSSSPPPPPPPVQYLINSGEGDCGFVQPNNFNRFPPPSTGDVNNTFNHQFIQQPEITKFNPNIPPPNIHQFVVNLPPLNQPASPQTPLQSEEQIHELSPSFKDQIITEKKDHSNEPPIYSPDSANSDEPDRQYDAYQDDFFADNSKVEKSPSPDSPENDDLSDTDIAEQTKVSEEIKPAQPSLEQHKLAKISPFNINNKKKSIPANSNINQVFGTVAPQTKSPSPLPVLIPGLSDSVVGSLEQLTSLLNSASASSSMVKVNNDFKQPDYSSLNNFVSNQSPLAEEFEIPLDLAANASQQTIQLARQLGLFELTKVLEQATGNVESTSIHKEKTDKSEAKKPKVEHKNPSHDKLTRVERIAEEVKLALKPHFAKNIINKEDYKDIMRKAVPKISGSKSDVDRNRIKAFVFEYVQKIHHAKKLAKSEHKKFEKNND